MWFSGLLVVSTTFYHWAPPRLCRSFEWTRACAATRRLLAVFKTPAFDAEANVQVCGRVKASAEFKPQLCLNKFIANAHVRTDATQTSLASSLRLKSIGSENINSYFILIVPQNFSARMKFNNEYTRPIIVTK